MPLWSPDCARGDKRPVAFEINVIIEGLAHYASAPKEVSSPPDPPFGRSALFTPSTMRFAPVSPYFASPLSVPIVVTKST